MHVFTHTITNLHCCPVSVDQEGLSATQHNKQQNNKQGPSHMHTHTYSYTEILAHDKMGKKQNHINAIRQDLIHNTLPHSTPQSVKKCK